MNALYAGLLAFGLVGGALGVAYVLAELRMAEEDAGFSAEELAYIAAIEEQRVRQAEAGPTPRTDCDQMRGTDYAAEGEREWFLEHCVTPEAPQEYEPTSVTECESIPRYQWTVECVERQAAECSDVFRSLPFYQWPAECIGLDWLPFDCDWLRYRARINSAPPLEWRDWYIANCDPPPRDESGLPPYQLQRTGVS